MKWARMIGLGVILAMGMLLFGALAADPTLEAKGTVNSKITISVSPNNWEFTSDPDVENTNTATITVSSNKAWTVTAKDNQVNSKPNKGHMVLYTGSGWGSAYLTDPLYIQDANGQYVNLENDQTVCTGSKGKDITNQKTLKQKMEYTDDPTTESNCYRMIVAFTATQQS